MRQGPLKLKRRGPWLTQQDQSLREEEEKKRILRNVHMDFHWPPQDIVYNADYPLKLALTLGYGFGEAFKSWLPKWVYKELQSVAFKQYPDNFTSAVVWRTLENRVYIFDWITPQGDYLPPVCFISSSVNCRIVFQRPGNEIVMSTWWNNGDCVVDWFGSGWGDEVMSLARLPQWLQW